MSVLRKNSMSINEFVTLEDRTASLYFYCIVFLAKNTDSSREKTNILDIIETEKGSTVKF